MRGLSKWKDLSGSPGRLKSAIPNTLARLFTPDDMRFDATLVNSARQCSVSSGEIFFCENRRATNLSISCAWPSGNKSESDSERTSATSRS